MSEHYDELLGRSRKGTYKVSMIVSGEPDEIERASFLVPRHDETYGTIEKTVKIEKNWSEDDG